MTNSAQQKKAKTFLVRHPNHRERLYAPSGGDSLTQQHAKDECDINIIIKRHSQSGNISHLNPKTPLYVDCTGITDLLGAIELVEEAEDNFATLPAAVRKACDNDPVRFVHMIASVEGTQELADAGLLFQQDQQEQLELPPTPRATPPKPTQPTTNQPAGTDQDTTPPTPQGGE